MRVGADGGPGERPDDGETGLLDVPLHGGTDVSDSVADPGLFDPNAQGLPGDVHQPLGQRRNLTDADAEPGIRPETTVDQAGVEAPSGALAQLALGRDPVNDLAVPRGAARVPAYLAPGA